MRFLNGIAKKESMFCIGVLNNKKSQLGQHSIPTDISELVTSKILTLWTLGTLKLTLREKKYKAQGASIEQ